MVHLQTVREHAESGHHHHNVQVEVTAEEVGEAGRYHRADAEHESVEDAHLTAILRPHHLNHCNKDPAPTRQSRNVKGER